MRSATSDCRLGGFPVRFPRRSLQCSNLCRSSHRVDHHGVPPKSPVGLRCYRLVRADTVNPNRLSISGRVCTCCELVRLLGWTNTGSLVDIYKCLYRKYLAAIGGQEHRLGSKTDVSLGRTCAYARIALGCQVGIYGVDTVSIRCGYGEDTVCAAARVLGVSH